MYSFVFVASSVASSVHSASSARKDTRLHRFLVRRSSSQCQYYSVSQRSRHTFTHEYIYTHSLLHLLLHRAASVERSYVRRGDSGQNLSRCPSNFWRAGLALPHSMATRPRRVPIEQQIQELQRKFRALENDSRAFSEDAQAQIRRQRVAIEKFSRENRVMKQELQQTREAITDQQNALMGAKMQALNEQHHALLRDIAEEKRKEKDVTAKIHIIEDRVMKCRERMGPMGGVYCAVASSESIAKQMSILENRLNKGMQKYSEAVAYNKKLKEDINNMRRERVSFENVYRRMRRDLVEKKRSMAEIINVANAAYKVRDEAQKQVALLKAQAGKEHRDFEKEWTELGRLIEAYQHSQQTKQINNRPEQTPQRRPVTSSGDEETQRCLQNGWSLSGDGGRADETAAKIESYQEAFAKIQAATGMPSVYKLIEAFTNAEEQNFSLFNYVNALSSDIEAAEAHILQLQRDIDNFQSSSCVADKRKQEVLQSLETYSNTVERKTRLFEEKNEDISKKASELKAGIKEIFDVVNAQKMLTQQQKEMWLNQEFTDSNVVTLLQNVEQRIDTIASFYSQEITPENIRATATAAAAVERQQKKGNTVQICLPSTLEGLSSREHSDDEESDTRPLTREELRMRLLKGRNKKEDRKKNKSKKPNGYK